MLDLRCWIPNLHPTWVVNWRMYIWSDPRQGRAWSRHPFLIRTSGCASVGFPLKCKRQGSELHQLHRKRYCGSRVEVIPPHFGTVGMDAHTAHASHHSSGFSLFTPASSPASCTRSSLKPKAASITLLLWWWACNRAAVSRELTQNGPSAHRPSGVVSSTPGLF